MANETKKNPSLIIIAVIAGLIIGITLGIVISKLTNKSSTISTQNQTTSGINIDESFFDDQSALVHAKVKDVSASSITLEKLEGKQASYALNNQVAISKQSSNLRTSSASAVTDIKVGEFVIMNLKKINGLFQVVSIVIPPPIGTPPPPPISTPRPAASTNN
jgi:uncharacterized membrane protein YraQ (UPF0718 family)